MNIEYRKAIFRSLTKINCIWFVSFLQFLKNIVYMGTNAACLGQYEDSSFLKIWFIENLSDILDKLFIELIQ